VKVATRPSPSLFAFLILAFLLPAGISFGQEIFFWRNEATNGNWNQSGNWFHSQNSSTTDVPGGNEILRFSNNAQLSMTNNLANTSRFRIEFLSGSGARTVGGTTANTFFDFGGQVPAIYNDSGNTQTINFKIINGNSTGSNRLELNANNGSLVFGGDVSASGGNRTVVAMGPGNVTINGIVMQESGATLNLLKEGAGTLTLTNASNSYTGTTTISAGRISVDADATLGSGAGTLFLSGGILNTTASRTVAVSNNVVVTADSAITTTSAAAAPVFNFTGTLTGTGGTLTFRNDATTTTGVFSPRFSGGDFTMSRPIVIDNGAGGGTTQLNDFNTTGTTHTYTGAISGNGSYNRNATTAGSGGTTVFTANNTYTGTTTVNRGTLEVANTNSSSSGRISGTSEISVNSTGTLLLSGSSSWTDRINNAAPITLAGGTFNLNGMSEGTAASGGSGIGALTLSATSTIDFGTSAIQNNIVHFGGVGPHTLGGPDLLITDWNGTPSSGGGPERLLFSGPITDFTSQYAQNDVSFNGLAGYSAVQFTGFYEITAVPEPSTWIAGGLAFVALAFSQRRRFSRLLRKAS
jgi:autotransporter-associated beta strand protein